MTDTWKRVSVGIGAVSISTYLALNFHEGWTAFLAAVISAYLVVENAKLYQSLSNHLRELRLAGESAIPNQIASYFVFLFLLITPLFIPRFVDWLVHEFV